MIVQTNKPSDPKSLALEIGLVILLSKGENFFVYYCDEPEVSSEGEVSLQFMDAKLQVPKVYHTETTVEWDTILKGVCNFLVPKHDTATVYYFTSLITLKDTVNELLSWT